MSLLSVTVINCEECEQEELVRDVLARDRPAVLKGLVKNWEITRRGQSSPQQLSAYLQRFYHGAPLEVWLGPPSIKGRFFYRDDMQGFNFDRKKAHLPTALQYLMDQNAQSQPEAVYVGATSIPDTLPGLESENSLSLVSREVPPNIWIGNRVKISCHFDTSKNIACNVAGRRRFTLFPPEEIGSLYVGPIDLTPAGQPISLVDVNHPDFERFPRFKTALRSARVADLEPGDAIYMPAMWWHHVESLDDVNVLINYWWNNNAQVDSPFESLVHSILAVGSLPAEEKRAWQAFYEHYVFNDEHPAAHIPPAKRGALGRLTPAVAGRIRNFLRQSINSR